MREKRRDRCSQRAEMYEFIFKKCVKDVKGVGFWIWVALRAVYIYFAQSGASCIGVDIRRQHLKKAEFASKVLKLEDKCKYRR